MKKITIFILTLLLCVIPVEAKTPKQILILGKELPDMYILQYDGNKRFKVKMISRKTAMPLTCLNQDKARFDELKLNETAIKCEVASLNKEMHLSIKNYIRLDMKNIAKDFHINLSDYNLHDFNSTLKIFQIIGSNLNFNIILNYKDYIKTDLSWNELYTLFKQYQNGPISVSYEYPYLIWIPQKSSYYPLQSSFHSK